MIKQLNENILKLLLEKTGHHFIEKIKDKVQCYIVDATDFAYGDIYSLKMLNQILNKVDFIKGLFFIVDKGYDSISILVLIFRRNSF